MNTLKDVIGMGGGLFEEAHNIGRREAMKEIQGGKYEMLEETNRNLRAQLDSYEKIRLTQDEEIHRLKADLEKTWEEKETLQVKHDNYERNRCEASKEIDRLKAKTKKLDAENDRLFNENGDLWRKLKDAEAKIKELNEALETNQETEPKPKPCPFCGEEPRIYGDKPQAYIACVNKDCQVNPETIFFLTRTGAIEAWNRRAE